MDIQTILTIIGITATVLFGVWAILITFRSNKGVEITYIEDQCISLIDDITQSFSELNISYGNKPISDNLVLLKGYFINTGRKDISIDMVEENIVLNLPEDFEWIDCKVADSSKSLKVKAKKIDKFKIELDIGLWKIKEFCKFDALAKVPVIEVDENKLNGEKPNTRLWNALNFSHRIADSDKIQVAKVPKVGKKPSSSYLFPFSTKFRMIVGFVTILMGVVLTLLPGLFADKTISYNINIDGENRLVSVKVKKESLVLSDKKGFSKNLTIEKFNNIKDKQAVISVKSDRIFRIFGYVYIILGSVLIVLIFVRRLKEKRILSLITSQGKT